MENLNNIYSFDIKEKKELNENKLYSTENKNINRISIKKKIIKRNNNHNDFGNQLTYNKKLSSELDSLPLNINKKFRKSLNKYKFKLEVYVPNSMRVSKKEYLNKDYMLNSLVKTQIKIEGEKNKLKNITKETSTFSNQYKLVKNENKNKQKEFLLDIEKEYKKKKNKEIKYKKNENIFAPSLLLDLDYGNNINSDMNKYGHNLNEIKKDKNILQKFYDVIYRKDKKEKEIEINKEKEDKINKIKDELNEQIKIGNMNKKEYLNYSKQLKKEIKKIKSMIDFDLFKTDYFNKNINIKSIENKSFINKSNNSIEKNNKLLKDKYYKDIGMESSEKLKLKNNNYFKIKNIENKKDKNLKNKIPKLELEKNNIKLKETKKIKLNKIYNSLNSKTSSNNFEFQYKQMNQYFLLYSPKKLPKLNIERGSNIHGLIETTQNIINDNNISSFSKLNENLKKDIFINNDYSQIKKIETENIINLDDKILGLHYELADSLLSNKRDKFLKFFKK